METPPESLFNFEGLKLNLKGTARRWEQWRAVLLKEQRKIFREEKWLRTRQLNSSLHGGIAQLGERLLCKQEVNGSIPFISTNGYCG